MKTKREKREKTEENRIPTYFMEKMLSEKEIEVLKLMIDGNSNPKIAKLLDISQNTVKAHTTKIYEKLCVENRAQAAVKAIQLGIVE